MSQPNNPADVLPPLHESLPYYAPLLLMHEQHAWLRERFPAAAWSHCPLRLTHAEIRQRPWEASRLFTLLAPFPLAAELSGLPRLAREALARLHSGETIPGEVTADAAPQAWLDPRSVLLVPPVSEADPYRVALSFVSTRTLYHPLHSCYDAIIRETAQTVRAALLEVRVQQLQERLAQASSAGEPLAPPEHDHRQDEPKG